MTVKNKWKKLKQKKQPDIWQTIELHFLDNEIYKLITDPDMDRTSLRALLDHHKWETHRDIPRRFYSGEKE